MFNYPKFLMAKYSGEGEGEGEGSGGSSGGSPPPSSGGSGGSPPPPPSNIKYYSLSALENNIVELFGSGGNGKITYESTAVRNINGEYSIPEDTKFDFKIIPNKYYSINDVKINGQSAGSSGVYSISAVIEDIKIDVDFKPTPISKYDMQLIPTDFLFVKYDDASLIPLEVSRNNSFKYAENRSRLYNLFIHDSLEFKKLNLLLDTSNLWALSNPGLGTGNYYGSINPYKIGSSEIIGGAENLKLKPFISSSLLVIKSIDLIKITSPESIYQEEFTKDFSIDYKNKPYKVEDFDFTFESNKAYIIEFKNYVYYYNDDKKYDNIPADLYSTKILVSFNSVGIFDFKNIYTDPTEKYNPTDTLDDTKKYKSMDTLFDILEKNAEDSSNLFKPPDIKDTSDDILKTPGGHGGHENIKLEKKDAPNLRGQSLSSMRQTCKTCIFAKNNFCSLYNFETKADEVCDSWAINGITVENKYSKGEYLLKGVPYFGKYYLKSDNISSNYTAYTGVYYGDPLGGKLLDINSTIKILSSNFIFDDDILTYTRSESKYKTLDTIVTSSLFTEVFNKSNISKDIAELNIDYSEFKNFIVFSSAYERVFNFRYKLEEIENYDFKISNIINQGSTTNTLITQSLTQLELEKSKLINLFDNFENYLYFESGSSVASFTGSISPHPKSNNTKPYESYSVTSSASVNYFNNLFQSASIYDEENYSIVTKYLPNFINNNELDFSGYKRLMLMFGHFFDLIYLYARELANKKFVDIRESGNIPNIYINYLLEYYSLFNKSKKLDTNLELFFTKSISSLPNYLGDYREYSKELYMRLLNVGPYIMKSRGTKKSIRAILNVFGMSDEYIQIKEAGNNKNNFDDDIDDIKIDKDIVKRYYLNFKGSQNIKANWVINSSTLQSPNSIQLKFKSNNNTGLYTTQVLLEGSSSISGSWGIVLQNSGSTYGSTSAIVKFILSGSVSCSTSELPIFNNSPWTLYFNRDTTTYSAPTQSYNLVVKQEKFGELNFQASSSLIITASSLNDRYSTSGSLYLGGASTSSINSSVYGKPYYGKLAEFRLWKTILTNELNDIFVKAGNFYGGTSLSSSFNDLILWYKLNQDINHYSTSSVNDYNLTGVKNHGTASNFENFSSDTNYSYDWEEENIELENFDTQTYSDKKINILSRPTSSVYLSSISKIDTSAEKLFGTESNKLYVEISTNNLINQDIIKSVDFELDNYIGDPRDQTNTSYGSLETFKLAYLKKYSASKINLYSIFNFGKGYDYAVFELIKKNVPFKSDLHLGFKLEQTAVERFKTKIKQSVYSTYNKYEINLNCSPEATSIFTDQEAVIDDMRSIFSKGTSVSVLLLRSNIKLALKDLKYKKDKYDTSLSNVSGFSNPITTQINPTSEFSQVYIKSGSVFSQAFDSALEPTWAIINGVLNSKYSADHIIYTRDDRFRLLRVGTTQVEICDLDGKNIIEITKTTSRIPVVYDTNDGDAILRV